MKVEIYYTTKQGYVAMPNERLVVKDLKEAVEKAVYKIKNTTRGADVYTFTVDIPSIKASYLHSWDGRQL